MLEKLLDRWYLIPLAPGMEVVIAALLVGVLGFVFRKRLKVAAGAQLRVSTGIRLVAGSMILASIMDLTVRMLTWAAWEVRWWEYALPLAVAAAGILLTIVTTPRFVHRAGVPAGIGLRRNWVSYTDRAPLAMSAAVAVLLVIITVACGLASSPDDLGRYSILVDDGGGYGTFYGWAYGVPVLVSLVALLAVLWFALHRLALPPFSNPIAVEQETVQRRIASTATVWVAGSALVLTLGCIVNSVGYSGSGTTGVGIPGVGDFMWRSGFASFAEFFIWSGWALEVSAFMCLFLLVLGFVPGKTFTVGAAREAARVGAL